jgi:hypothetical protein
MGGYGAFLMDLNYHFEKGGICNKEIQAITKLVKISKNHKTANS